MSAKSRLYGKGASDGTVALVTLGMFGVVGMFVYLFKKQSQYESQANYYTSQIPQAANQVAQAVDQAAQGSGGQT